MAASGVWSWTDGKPFTYHDWKTGEPNDSPGSDCGQIQIADGLWSALNCFTKLPFICTTPAVTGATCPATCDDGWAVFNQSCYKLGFNAKFDDAEASCVGSGGHLTSIHSTQESIFVSGKVQILVPYFCINFQPWQEVDLMKTALSNLGSD